MKIIITETFLKKDYKYLDKYFSLQLFVDKIRQIHPIILKFPYFKIKFFLNWIAFRWVIMQTKWWNLVPLLLYLKKDKIGENIIWSKYERLIFDKQNQILRDIENKKYSVF